ncbi:MAG TPA: TIGR03862 family flavoprotein [Anaerolineaceae bacterium]|nr:TIGR03862 family flavoprotein [Anaerolineaceae bacterium]
MINDVNGSILNVTVIGGGPAGMMAAEFLANQGISVDVFDAKPAVLRKFLAAGKGGLNLTKAENFDLFLSRYGKNAIQLQPYLQLFGPDQMRAWAEELGQPTFIGTSSRVFPQKMNAIQLRIDWIERLIKQGVQFHLNHRWIGWNLPNELLFQSPKGTTTIKPDAMILALGGASWPKTGSDGKWSQIMLEKGILLSPFQPSNCGFDVQWTDHFRDRYQGTPIKTVTLKFTPTNGKPSEHPGEFIITKYGVEGSLIYFFSPAIRDEIINFGKATIFLDLAPDWNLDKLRVRLSRPRGSRSISSHLQKSVGLHGVKASLLWEFLPQDIRNNSDELAKSIKALPVPLLAPRPIEEAISTAGGVSFENLNLELMLRDYPGVFCAGEMLDWEAPTGGYLLTACFSTGVAAAQGVMNWLKN